MRRVTKEEAIKNKNSNYYCKCINCNYAWEITQEEWDYDYENLDLKCANCGEDAMRYIAGDYYYLENIIDPGEIPYGIVSDDVTDEQILADFSMDDKLYFVCHKCGTTIKVKGWLPDKYKCDGCGFSGYMFCIVDRQTLLLRKKNKVESPQETYYCYVKGNRPPMKEHYSEDEARTEARRLAQLPDNIGIPVLILKVVSTVTSKIVLEEK